MSRPAGSVDAGRRAGAGPLALAVAVALVLAGLAALAPAGAAAGIIEPADQAELANALAEAQSVQGVCYGWNVDNNFDNQPDVGSSTGGPGQPLEPGACRAYVILTGFIDYACETCDASDDATVGIVSNLPGQPSETDLRNLGFEPKDLVGDQDDVALFNMVNGLPLLVAQQGAAPPVPYEPAASVPATDVPMNSPGSDLLRDAWLGLLFFGFIALCGPLYGLYKHIRGPQQPST